MSVSQVSSRGLTVMPIEEFINYQILGQDSSAKLVFLHGIMGQGRNWLSIAKKFSSQFQCLLFDQRGHGQSAQPTSGYGLDDYVEDLKSLLDSLKWHDPIYLIGHSMGGRVALMFANKYPERLEKLVIVDIGASSNWQSMQSILEKVDFVPTPFDDRKQARDYLENEFMTRYKNAMVMEFFYSNLVDKQGSYDWTFSKDGIRQTLELARYKDYWSEFKALSMPSLLIRGEKSTDLSRDEYLKILENNSHIQGEEVKGAGHWVHAEKPLETMKIIGNFFNIAPKH
jgi:esterase